MQMRNFSGVDGSYNIYHFPTSKENLGIKFVNKSTLTFDYNGSTYTLEDIDGLRFKMKNNATDLEKRIPASFQAILNEFMTIDITDDNYFVYETKTVIIPIANIMANDVDVVSGGLNPLTLNGISDITLGTAVINGSNIEYTNTSGSQGEVATITYEAKNFNGDVTTGTINIRIDAIPPIICNPDTFDLQQGETLLLSKSALSSNDVDGLGKTLTVTAVINPVNGSVSLNGDNVSFTSTGISGFPAEFDYTVQNTDGATQTGKVYVNVTPLPPIEALIYSDADLLQIKVDSGYTPPTVLDIFNTWARYDGADYYANKDSAAGTALDWEFLTDPDRVSMPTNTALGCGFISPDKLDNYTFEATLTSTSTDDDGIGLVIAFNNSGGTNEVLFLNRTQGGVAPGNGFGMIYGANGATNTWVIHDVSVGGTNKNGDNGNGDKNGWNNRQSRVKIERRGDIITCYATEWDDVNNYQLSSKITLDLASDSRLAPFRGKQSYGYYTHSQAGSTYLDAVTTGGMDSARLFNAGTNEVWNFDGYNWSVEPTETVQSVLGYVRECTNPETGITYIIKGDEVILKP